jgi:hypothetical protein
MSLTPAGSQWLKERYNISGYTLTHTSFIGSHDSIEITNKGNIEQVYTRRYAPAENTSLAHLEFSLKYDDLNLPFLKKVFESIEAKEIEKFIDASPSGKYARKIGFLFEFT